MKTQAYENTKVVNLNNELNNNEYKEISKNLALTVRKEHRLTVVKSVARTTIRMSWKTLLYVAFLMVANILV